MSDTYSIKIATKSSRYFVYFLIALLLVLFLGPWWMSRGDMRLTIEIATYLTLATMWNLLAGYAGMVSVGQQAFVGIGGYLLFACVIFFGWNPIYSIPLIGILVAIMAIPTATIAFRLEGSYFAIGTWVIAEIYMLASSQISALGGGSGISLPIKAIKAIADGRDAREAVIYFTAIALAIFAIAFTYALLRSRLGLALTAIRDNSLASASVGVNTQKVKYIVYISVACITGMAGALIFLSKLRISPTIAFSMLDWTAYIIFIVVIGGIGKIEGPIIGTIVYFVLRTFLADLGTIYLIILGVLAIVVMLKSPGGIWGIIQDKYNIELFPLHRKLVKREKQ